MKNRIKAPALALAAALSMSGCDALLDVENPNNLVEASIRAAAAANAVANGAERLVAQAISNAWQPVLVASDELYWVGSRDGWGQLDQGFTGSTTNEFTDAAFPPLGQASWMVREAVEILGEHVAAAPTVISFQRDLARANMYAGMIYMVIGEIQEDMTFSDRQTDGAPVGPANMFQVLDQAIAYLDAAVTGFSAAGVGSAAQISQATALRARAKMSRAIWNQLNPAAQVGGALAMPTAAADALIALGQVSADYRSNLTFSATTYASDIASWMNQRKENQIDQSLVTVDAAYNISGIQMVDPITGVADAALINHLNQFKGGNYLNSATQGANQYVPLTVVSARLLHLIVAEDALANSNTALFDTHINAIRALDGQTAFDAANAAHPTRLAMLQHTRRMNTLLMGLRMQDMYRWGIVPTGNPVPNTTWAPASDAAVRPGEMMPIPNIELQANCFLNGSC